MVSTSSQPPGHSKKSLSVVLTDSRKRACFSEGNSVHRVGRRSQRAVWAAPSAWVMCVDGCRHTPETEAKEKDTQPCQPLSHPPWGASTLAHPGSPGRLLRSCSCCWGMPRGQELGVRGRPKLTGQWWLWFSGPASHLARTCTMSYKGRAFQPSGRADPCWRPIAKPGAAQGGAPGLSALLLWEHRQLTRPVQPARHLPCLLNRLPLPVRAPGRAGWEGRAANPSLHPGQAWEVFTNTWGIQWAGQGSAGLGIGGAQAWHWPCSCRWGPRLHTWTLGL